MKTAIIIPARFQSTRLPGKPLLKETGKYLIQHCLENASRANVDEILVATDDERIMEAVQSFGAKAVLTAKDHESGSARIAEAARGLDADIIINVQGDEPEIDPSMIDRLIDLHRKAMTEEKDIWASTLVSPFPENIMEGHGSPADPSCVKAILSAPDEANIRQALYFTRALAPYPRDDGGAIRRPQDYFLHIGIYAFSRDSLQRFAKAPLGRLEQIEKLEQLRILELGGRIAVEIVDSAAPGIDTPQDYERFVERVGRRA